MGLDSHKELLIPVAEEVNLEGLEEVLLPMITLWAPRVTLFHVIRVPETLPVEADEFKQEADRARSKLRVVYNWFRKQGCAVRLEIVAARNVAEGIVQEANTGRYLAVVLMKRVGKRGILNRLFRRSVSEAVVRKVTCPVIIIPLRERPKKA